MTTKKERNITKKFISLAVGGALLVAGIALILTQWNCVVILFKGVIGMILAIIGLLVLMLIKG